MKRLLSLLLIIFVSTACVTPVCAKPSQSKLDYVNDNMEKMDEKLQNALSTYENYKKAGKLYTNQRDSLKVFEILKKIEGAVMAPDYYYKTAIKDGWTKDNEVLTKCRTKLYEYYNGKIKIPDVHFIIYVDEEEYPEHDTLSQMCDIMRMAAIFAREHGTSATDIIYSKIDDKNRRYKRMMEAIEKAKLDGSSRYGTADIESKPVFQRALTLLNKYGDQCDVVLKKSKEKRDAVKAEMKKLLEVYTKMNKSLFENIYNKDYSSNEQKVADALDKFEKELWPQHSSFIEGLANKWAPKTRTKLENQLDIDNEVNQSVQILLGEDYRDATNKFKSPGNMISTIIIKKTWIPAIRKKSSTFVLEGVQRNLESVSHYAENLQSEKFKEAIVPLALVLQFNPNNEDAKKLKEKFKDKLAELEAELNAKIDKNEWAPKHSDKAPADAVAISEAAWKILMADKTWNGGKRHMLAMKTIGDWSVMERNILKAPVMYGISVAVVAQFDEQKGKDLCWRYNLKFFTKKGPDVKPGLPLSYYAGGSRFQMRISKVKTGIPGSSIADAHVAKEIAATGAAVGSSGSGWMGGSSAGSGTIGTLIRLLMSLLLVVSGLLAAATAVSAKIPALKDPLSKLEPHSAKVGVATLATGAISFIHSLLSFSPLTNIIPQASAISVGLLLGKSILLKKAAAPAVANEEKVETDSSTSDEKTDDGDGESKSEESAADKAAEVADKAAEVAEKASEVAGDAAKAAQDLLIKNKQIFDKLEGVKIPVGLVSAAAGVLHLLFGGWGLF